MYSSYLKISFSFIVANPTILHRYKCLCSVSDIRARIYAFYLLYFFTSPSQTSIFFFGSKKNVIHHSIMEYIFGQKSRFVLFILFLLRYFFAFVAVVISNTPNPMSEYVKDLSISIGSLISILPPFLPFQSPYTLTIESKGKKQQIHSGILKGDRRYYSVIVTQDIWI